MQTGVHNFPRGEITQSHREAQYVATASHPERELKFASEPERHTEPRDGGRWERIGLVWTRREVLRAYAPSWQCERSWRLRRLGSVVVAVEEPWRD